MRCSWLYVLVGFRSKFDDYTVAFDFTCITYLEVGTNIVITEIQFSEGSQVGKRVVGENGKAIVGQVEMNQTGYGLKHGTVQVLHSIV